MLRSVLCSAVGLDSKERSADYIKPYRGDEKQLAESLKSIHTACSQLLPHLIDRQRMAG
jgi:hypothetical protein